jgi:VanZ family protein
VPLVIWAGIIIISSAVPAGWFPQLPYWWVPKTVHIVFFFFLCLLLYRALRYQQSHPILRKHALALSIVCTIFFAVADETHQLFVEGRTARFSDVALDASSAFLFLLLHRVTTAIRSSRPQACRP